MEFLIAFLQRYETVLTTMAESEKRFGTYTSLKPPSDDRTPVPCLASWSLNQMFQTTPYLQQCVKVSVSVPAISTTEYFFLMTERIGDQHSWARS